MAVTIFSRQAGLVASFPDPTLPATTTLNIEGWGGFTGFKSIITRVNVSAQGNFQFLHTLGGNIYVYVFGDRIGQLGISGLAFESVCGNTAGAIGIERVLDYYASNRIASRKTPIKVTLGVSTTVAGYLVAVAGDIVDPSSKMYQFSLQFIMAPQSRIPCSAIAPDEPAAEEEAAPAEEPQQESAFANDTLNDYPIPTGTVHADGSLSSGSSHSITSAGYSPVGTGPNIGMTASQVR